MKTGLVIGCASQDTLHLAGQTVRTIGGAGLYTALAAARVGAAVTLFAPKPSPMPRAFTAIETIIRWIGPETAPDRLPTLEIAHHGAGRATLLQAEWGAEAGLTPALLPADLAPYDFVHIAALSSARKQLDFLRACRERGVRYVSAGTYARIAYGETEAVRQLFTECDVFFMNENESNALGADGRQSFSTRSGLYFVTRGERGVTVFENQTVVAIPAPPAAEVDPTGAGDAFCGAALGLMALGASAAEAAPRAVQLAARVVESLGPAALFPSHNGKPTEPC